jgi:hypothetical protein
MKKNIPQFEAYLKLLARFEQEDGNLTQVEIDEVLSLVSHIGTEVSSHNAMPSWIVFLVEFFLDVCRNILLDVVLFHRLCRTIDCVLLHILWKPKHIH